MFPAYESLLTFSSSQLPYHRKKAVGKLSRALNLQYPAPRFFQSYVPTLIEYLAAPRFEKYESALLGFPEVIQNGTSEDLHLIEKSLETTLIYLKDPEPAKFEEAYEAAAKITVPKPEKRRLPWPTLRVIAQHSSVISIFLVVSWIFGFSVSVEILGTSVDAAYGRFLGISATLIGAYLAATIIRLQRAQ